MTRVPLPLIRLLVLVLTSGALHLAGCRAGVPAAGGATARRPDMEWWRRSMETREQRMGWFREARFGMFVHWGVYSHAGGVWEGKPVSGYAEHLMRKVKMSPADYRARVAALFAPGEFDADQWIATARRAGMGYFVITAKHHDGFAMWDSAVSGLDVIEATPWKRDPLRELREACQRHGVRFGVYYSHARDWADGPREDWQGTRPAPPAGATSYVDAKAIPQVRELVARYDPDLIWFDTPEKLPAEENLRILRAAREAKPTVVVNGRAVQVTPDGPPARYGDYLSTTDKPAEFPPHPGDWEAIPTTNESYGWHRMDLSHKPAAHFIGLLAKAAARGGNVLLNIGPMGNGRFDPRDQTILDGIAAWMKANGASIRGTTRAPLPVQAWGESTRRGSTVYLHVLSWPRRGRLVVGGLKSPVKQAYLLADPRRAPLEVERLSERDLVIEVPRAAPDAADTVIAVEVAGTEPAVDPVRLLGGAEVAAETLRAFDGQLRGGGLGYGKGKAQDAHVLGWSTGSASVRWPVRARESTTYDVAVVYDAEPKSAGGAFVVRVGKHDLEGKVEGGSMLTRPLGRATVEAGELELAVEGREIVGGELFRLRGLVLTAVAPVQSMAKQ